MNKTALLAFAAVFLLVALAALILIMPPVGTWVVVLGIAVVAGGLSAWAGQELGVLLLGIRQGIDAGTEKTLTALAEANEATKAAQSEANNTLAERFERFCEEYGKRDEEWRTKTLADWQAVKQTLDSSFEQALAHLAKLAEQEAETAEARTEAARSELAQLCAGMKEAAEQHTAVIQETAKAVETHLSNQQESEAKLRQDALAGWQAVTRELGSSFEQNLSVMAEQERVWQEKAAQSRTEALDAELAKVKETFELIEDTRNKLNTEFEKAVEALGALIETETQRQKERKRADRDHFEKMLEAQQEAHADADERSEKLWGHLLDRLKE